MTNLLKRLHTRAGAVLSEKSLGHVAKIADHQAKIAAHVEALTASAAGEATLDADEIEEEAAGDGADEPEGGSDGTTQGPSTEPQCGA